MSQVRYVLARPREHPYARSAPYQGTPDPEITKIKAGGRFHDSIGQPSDNVIGRFASSCGIKQTNSNLFRDRTKRLLFRDAVQDLYSTDPTRKHPLDHADCAAPTRQHELDLKDHTDHDYSCPERSRFMK